MINFEKSPCRRQQAFYYSLLIFCTFTAYSKFLFIDHIIHHFNLATCMYAQSSLAIVFYRSHSELHDALMYRKLEWLVYRISLFILCAPSDDPMYNSTTDQCGARSGSSQLIKFHKCLFQVPNKNFGQSLHGITNIVD